jgi:uncharacterized membrane protein
VELQLAFNAWLFEQREEDLKFVRFHLAGVTVIQSVIWFQDQYLSCNIPINLWLLVACLQMIADAVVKAAKIRRIDTYLLREERAGD